MRDRLAKVTSVRRNADVGLRLVCAAMVLVAFLLYYPQAALAQSTYGCATRGAVSDPVRNPGLVADCETLLGLKDTLRGSAPLDWDVETPHLAVGGCGRCLCGWY